MNLVKVKPSQFFGIEINSFATKVLKVCFLLSELKLSKTLIDVSVLDKNVLCKNALRINWNDLLPNKNCSYIISNPPFSGARVMTKEQKLDVLQIFKNTKNVGNIDYVGCWYKKSAEYMKNTLIKTALVSTNSICQGEQPAILWKPLFEFGIHINFAYKTFKWSSESINKAQVHCIIVGFSYIDETPKFIYSEGKILSVKNINAYLKDAPNVIIERRERPLCKNVPEIKIGNMPRDGGNFILTPKEKALFIKKEPLTKKYIRPYVGAKEFINNTKRYCLWLKDADPHEISKSKLILQRVLAVKKFRENSKAAGTRRYALTPTVFCEITQLSADFLLISSVSTQKREYIPMGLVSKNVIASDATHVLPFVSIYHFGVLTSSTHMAWMRAVCGRLGSAYRYSKDIVYNTFPWPKPTKTQKENIEKTAKNILDARKLYKNCTLAELYDPLTMPLELKKAHKFNDEAVINAYSFNKNITEDGIVAKLMEMYKELIMGDVK